MSQSQPPARPPREGGGLAPLHRGLSAADALTPMEDLLVLGPIRKKRHEAYELGDDVRVFDELIPLVADGLISVLKRERSRLSVDLDLSKVGEGKVE